MNAVLLIKHGGPEMPRYGLAPDPTAGLSEVSVVHPVSDKTLQRSEQSVAQTGGIETVVQNKRGR
jgi:hypothetical protein